MHDDRKLPFLLSAVCLGGLSVPCVVKGWYAGSTVLWGLAAGILFLGYLMPKRRIYIDTEDFKEESARAGFTLVELLVTIVIMVVLAALAVVAVPRLRDDYKVTKGAEQLQGWCYVAKQETYRDKLPRGVRLIRTVGKPNEVRELQYIEQPEEFNGGGIPAASSVVGSGNYWVGRPYGIQIPDPAKPGNFATALVTRVRPVKQIEDLTPVLWAGDWLSFDESPYTNHRIGSVMYDASGTHLVFAAADGTPSPVPVNGASGIGPGMTSWHVARQMRPRAGEAVLQLPKDVIVDLTQSLLPGASVPAADAGDSFLDIVFSLKGGLVGINGTSGTFGNSSVPSGIILWVRDGSKPTGVGDQVLIGIIGRTGLISAHPPAPGADPFAFVRDGRNSGM